MDSHLHTRLLLTAMVLIAPVTSHAESSDSERSGSFETYRPDATDRRALNELRRAVQRASRIDREYGLSNALEALSVKRGITALPDETVPDVQSGNPMRITARRPAAASLDEWRVFTRFRQEIAHVQTENNFISCELLDVDGDGRRDLVVDVFDKIGLSSSTYVLHRKQTRFVNPISSPPSEPVGIDNEFYTLSSRGANHGARWVRLQGRIYAAYFEGSYGADLIRLLRPLRRNDVAPTLTVRYAYTLKIPRRQAEESGRPGFELTAAQQRSLREGLATLLSPLGLPRQYTVGEPLCPEPVGVNAQDPEKYRGFGAGHSSYEAIGDFPVWYGQECRIGRLISWFSGYGKSGLGASLWVRDIDGSQPDEDFRITGRRRIIGLASSMTKVERN